MTESGTSESDSNKNTETPKYDSMEEISQYSILKKISVEQESHPAIIYKSRYISFHNLLSSIDSLASYMSGMELVKGDRVAIFLENSPHFVISIYASMKIGAIAAPMDPELSNIEMRNSINSIGAKCIIISDVGFTKISDLAKKGINVIVVRYQDFMSFENGVARTFENLGVISQIPWSKSIVKFSDAMFEVPREEEELDLYRDTSLLIQTHSISGEQRFVKVTQMNLQAAIQSFNSWFPAFEKPLKVASLVPFFSIYSIVLSILIPFSRGWTAIIGDRLNITKEISDFILKNDPNLVLGNSFAVKLISGIEKKIRIKRKKVSPRIIISCLGNLPGDLLQKVEEELGFHIIEGYSIPEASGLTHLNDYDKNNRRSGSVGKALSMVVSEIVDEITGRPKQFMEEGQLTISGPQVTPGFWGLDEETKERIREGKFLTMDIAHKDKDSYYYITGRLNDQIYSGGIMISPREIEEVLTSIDTIAEAAVIGVPDKSGNEIIKAFITPAGGKRISLDRVTKIVASKLSPNKIPTEYVIMDGLPKTLNGNIIRRILKEEELAKQK
ncbi:class I adenylate-forming enzyme family protein [Oxyplasma meridianum]|uniref:Class I adenylate-forming enzyme family protein n=1 Tax=Oxyplasma meridianum TaxID=3073602 RepID=A0AAX4NIP3_9ARCH